ncbi:MAG: glycosyltransferase family 9 protein [Verrucomicrobiota bacterium]
MNILIIKPSSLGDIIHGLAVAQAIKSQRPQVRISWVARDIFAPLVEAATCIDQVIVFKRQAGFSGLREAVAELRQEHYDWVLDMQGLARSGWMTFRARAQNKAGRRDAREGASLAYAVTPALPAMGRGAHAQDILLEFLTLLGLEKRIEKPLHFSTEDIDPLSPMTRDAVILFPGSRRAEKEWPGFTALTSQLLDTGINAAVVWAGDQTISAQDDWPADRFLNLTGQTSLPQLVPLIAGARLCVCNDSGPMHLAAALGKPLLALFGPTPPERFGPWPMDDPRHHVMRAPQGELARLTTESVTTKVLQLLD